MFAHVETLIRGIDNHCVVKKTVLAQILDDTTDVAIDRVNHTHIVVHITLILPFSECLTREFVFLKLLDNWVIVAIPLRTLRRCHTFVVATSPLFKSCSGVNLVLLICHLIVIDEVHILYDTHLLLLCSQTTSIVIIESLWQRIGYIVIETKVTGIRVPHTVRRLVVHQQTERLVLIAFVLHPVNRHIGNDVRHIARTAYLLTIAEEVRVIVVALSDKDIPVVEACWQ